MPKPKAYDPVHGYMYQLLLWDKFNREYDHLDYAEDSKDKKHLINEYKIAYGADFRFKVELLPQKYWKKNSK